MRASEIFGEIFFFFFASYFSLEARQSTCSSPSPPSLHVLLPLALPGPSPPLLEESPPKPTKLNRGTQTKQTHRARPVIAKTLQKQKQKRKN